MKKMLFSAIAMVAFEGSAFASNEVVEFNSSSCNDIWQLSYDLHRIEGKSHSDATKEADNAKKNCLDGSGSNGPVTGVVIRP